MQASLMDEAIRASGAMSYGSMSRTNLFVRSSLKWPSSGLHRESPSMVFGHVAGDVEAKPAPHSDRLRCDEGLENSFPAIVRHTRTIVFYRNEFALGIGGNDNDGLEARFEVCLFLQPVRGVDDKVLKDLNHHATNCLNPKRLFGPLEDHVNSMTLEFVPVCQSHLFHELDPNQTWTLIGAFPSSFDQTPKCASEV